jgi:cytochrome c oxidase subunit II
MGLHNIKATLSGIGLALTSVVANAAYDYNLPPPGSQLTHDIYGLHVLIMWVCVVIFIVVFGAMFYSILKHRKSVGHKAEHFHENTAIEIAWTVIPFLILAGMAYPATKSVLNMKDTTSPDMTIKATAYQWRWEYDYMADGVKFISVLSTPYEQVTNDAPKGEHYLQEVNNPMVVPVGKKIRVVITSGDVIHGFYVPQLGVNQYGIPGFIKDAWFKVDQPGTYRGYCSQICGKEHSFMPIVVEAKSEADYAAWMTAQKAALAPAPAPAAAPAAEAPAAPAAEAPAAAAPAEHK